MSSPLRPAAAGGREQEDPTHHRARWSGYGSGLQAAAAGGIDLSLMSSLVVAVLALRMHAGAWRLMEIGISALSRDDRSKSRVVVVRADCALVVCRV
jgi:hypothetical protein